jgi:hypothetical protein
MPPKIVERTLEWPAIGIRDQTVTDWVVPDLQPFDVVAAGVSQLMIPKTSLPDRLFLTPWPPTRHMRFPFSYPLAQRIPLKLIFGRKKIGRDPA